MPLLKGDEMPAKFLHISDVHIGESNRETENLDTIVNFILDKEDWQDDKPFIIVTGDIVNDGGRAQFINARNAFERLSRAEFTMRFVPGNHDYGVIGNCASVDNFNNFRDIFKDFHEIEYPRLEKLGGHTLIGLDSMKGETGSLSEWWADGRLGGQIEWLKNELANFEDRNETEKTKHKIIVYLHHHPFIFPDDTLPEVFAEWAVHWLNDGPDFMKVVREQVDIVLFGHEHRHLDFSNTRFYDENKIRFVSSGKSTELGCEYPVDSSGIPSDNSTNGEHLMGRLIEIDDDGIISIDSVFFDGL